MAEEQRTDVVIVRVRPINDDPLADAGPDKNTASNRFVYLAGSGSDPDGDIIKYTWRQVRGDDVVIAYPTSAEARFKAPEVSGGASTELEFELTGTDPYGGEDTDTMAVTVVSDNVRASADAGSDQVVDEQTEVTLAGSGSDPDNAIYREMASPVAELDGLRIPVNVSWGYNYGNQKEVELCGSLLDAKKVA